MHLHGHKFHVVGMGLLDKGMTFDEVKKAVPKINLTNPPYKDTVRIEITLWPRFKSIETDLFRFGTLNF